MTHELPERYLSGIFGEGFERCPVTNRPYERGVGALSKEAQTAMYVREAKIADAKAKASG